MPRLKKITKKQAAAFSQVIKAIERAQKTGLVFLGKQFNLVGMTKDTANYEVKNDLLCRDGKGKNNLEYLSADVLYDSGADDYTHYITNKDDPYNGEFQETPEIYYYSQNN